MFGPGVDVLLLGLDTLSDLLRLMGALPLLLSSSDGEGVAEG